MGAGYKQANASDSRAPKACGTGLRAGSFSLRYKVSADYVAQWKTAYSTEQARTWERSNEATPLHPAPCTLHEHRKLPVIAYRTARTLTLVHHRASCGVRPTSRKGAVIRTVAWLQAQQTHNTVMRHVVETASLPATAFAEIRPKKSRQHCPRAPPPPPVQKKVLGD